MRSSDPSINCGNKKHSVHYRDIWLPWRQPKNVSYGGSIITEAGVDPHVVGLVYVAAHAPDVGEDEGALGKKTPSVLAKTEGAIKKTDDGFNYLNPADFPKLFAPRPSRI